MTENVIMHAFTQALEYIKGVWLGVNVAIWSVVDYSLVTDDYAVIKAGAKKFALEIGKILGDFRKDIGGWESRINAMMDFIDPNEGRTAAKEDIEKAKEYYDDVSDVLGNEVPFSLFEGKAKKVLDQFLGFSNGFNNAVEWYFK